MARIIKLVKAYKAIFIFLVVWELMSRLHIVNALFIPPFSKVVGSIGKLTAEGVLPLHIFISLKRSVLGFVIAVVVAIPLGLLLAGRSRRLQIALEPLIEVFSQTNPFIIFHILLFFLGIGEATKVSMIAWTCTWPILFNTYSGVRNIDPELLKAARGFGLKGYRLAQKVLIPAAAPGIFSGMRMSAGYSFVLLIAAEMMGASSGLGWLVISGQSGYQMVKVFAAVTVIAFLGLLMDAGMQAVESKVVFMEKKSFSAKVET